MRAIVSYFWRLCMLRSSPENIPPSTALMSALLTIYILIQTVSIAIDNSTPGIIPIFGTIFVGIALEAIVVFALLSLKNLKERFISTFSALLGCGTMVMLILLPLNLLLLRLADGILVDFIETLSILCFFWWLVIVGFILKRACDISLTQGIIVAFLIEYLGVLSTKMLFPEIY